MDTGTEALAIASAAAFAAALGVLVAGHAAPTGRAPMRDAVSDYGVGPQHLLYRAMVVLLGLGAALLVAALARFGGAGNVDLAWLAAYSASRLAIAFFMTDLPGRRVTTEGRIHAFLAAAAFTSIAFATADLTGALADVAGWGGQVHGWLHFLARAVAVTAIGTLIAYFVPFLRERAFGAVERLLYAASFGWLLLASIHLAWLVA